MIQKTDTILYALKNDNTDSHIWNSFYYEYYLTNGYLNEFKNSSDNVRIAELSTVKVAALTKKGVKLVKVSDLFSKVKTKVFQIPDFEKNLAYAIGESGIHQELLNLDSSAIANNSPLREILESHKNLLVNSTHYTFIRNLISNRYLNSFIIKAKNRFENKYQLLEVILDAVKFNSKLKNQVYDYIECCDQKYLAAAKIVA